MGLQGVELSGDVRIGHKQVWLLAHRGSGEALAQVTAN
jgi:hypothetical protein